MLKSLKFIVLVFTLALFRCTSPSIQKDTNNEKSKSQSSIDNFKYYTDKDSVEMSFLNEVTFKLSKNEYNSLVDRNPELLNDIIENPILLYYANGQNLEYGSEVGQDNYFMFYAYFVRQKNDGEKFKKIRKQLHSIYQNINSLHRNFEYDGTFFSHQFFRIPGYVEFALECYPKGKSPWDKTYNYSAQKKLYIQSLRQLIADEDRIDFNTVKSEKPERLKKLHAIVDTIESNITDLYYLRWAQSFQYDHYIYY